MCGRYSIADPRRCIEEFSILEKQPALEPRYNVAPSQGVWAVRIVPPRTERRLDLLRWGLLAPGARTSGGIVMARAESLAKRSSFAAAFRTRRCLLLADGFYEWRRDGNQSFPYHVRRTDGAPFGMAGVWEPAPPSDDPLSLDSCAVITRPARPPITMLHDRMPAILAANDHEAWLDPSFDDTDALTKILLHDAGVELVTFPVSPRVNSPANDDRDCLAPIAEGDRHGEQLELWRRG
ncbi:MAG TPA: SOS response-associated peptidase [Polyangiaceae bacterium]